MAWTLRDPRIQRVTGRGLARQLPGAKRSAPTALAVSPVAGVAELKVFLQYGCGLADGGLLDAERLGRFRVGGLRGAGPVADGPVHGRGKDSGSEAGQQVVGARQPPPARQR